MNSVGALAGRRRARAATILEVLVASVITIVCVTAAAGTLSMGFRFIAERRLRTTAELVCQSHMELLLATDRDRPLSADDCAPVRYTRDVAADARAAVFVASCEIAADAPRTPDRRYNRLTAFVRTSFDGRDLVTSFATYIPAGPP